MLLNIQPINFFSGGVDQDEEAGSSLLFQVTLACGCPTCAGGRFDPQRFRVKVHVYKGQEEVGVFRATYRGNVSEFECKLPKLASGSYSVEIDALDPETGAAGRLTAELFFH